MNKRTAIALFLTMFLTCLLLSSCGGRAGLTDKTNLISDINWIDETCNDISFKMPDDLEYTEEEMASGICENDEYSIAIWGTSHAEPTTIEHEKEWRFYNLYGENSSYEERTYTDVQDITVDGTTAAIGYAYNIYDDVEYESEEGIAEAAVIVLYDDMRSMININFRFYDNDIDKRDKQIISQFLNYIHKDKSNLGHSDYEENTNGVFWKKPNKLDYKYDYYTVDETNIKIPYPKGWTCKTDETGILTFNSPANDELLPNCVIYFHHYEDTYVPMQEMETLFEEDRLSDAFYYEGLTLRPERLDYPGDMIVDKAANPDDIVAANYTVTMDEMRAVQASEISRKYGKEDYCHQTTMFNWDNSTCALISMVPLDNKDTLYELMTFMMTNSEYEDGRNDEEM